MTTLPARQLHHLGLKELGAFPFHQGPRSRHQSNAKPGELAKPNARISAFQSPSSFGWWVISGNCSGTSREERKGHCPLPTFLPAFRAGIFIHERSTLSHEKSWRSVQLTAHSPSRSCRSSLPCTGDEPSINSRSNGGRLAYLKPHRVSSACTAP